MSSNHTEITQRTIAKVEASGSPYFIRDTDLVGFAIKVTAKGKATFIVEMRVKGKTSAVRYPIGNVEDSTVKDARDEAHLIIANAKRGFDPRYTREDKNPRAQSLRHHLEVYLKNKKIRKSTATTYRNQCNNAFKDWYKLPVDAITRELIENRKSELNNRFSDNYTNSCFRTLKAILETSDLPFNPVKKAFKKWGWSLQSTPTIEDQYLMPDKIRLLFKGYAESLKQDTKEIYAPTDIDEDGNHSVYLGEKPLPNIFAATVYLLLIGGRKQDAVNLQWNQIDFANKRITYPPSSRKENRPHLVPITGMLEDIIKRLPTYPDRPELVFGMSGEMFRTRYEKDIQSLIGYSSKCLRKTFAEHAGLQGFDDKAIGKSLNHSHATEGNVTTQHYYTGALVGTRVLNAMYFDLQQRFMHYILGGDLEKISESFAEQVIAIENVTPLLLYPTFFKMLASDEYKLFQKNVLKPLLRVYDAMGFDPKRSMLSPQLLQRLEKFSVDNLES